MVEALRRGSSNTVPHLIDCTEDHLATHNDQPKPFVWSATAESILDQVARARAPSAKQSLHDETHH